MALIICELNIFLMWSEKYIIVTGTVDYQEIKFGITDTKLYVPVVTLSAQDNAKFKIIKSFIKFFNISNTALVSRII